MLISTNEVDTLINALVSNSIHKDVLRDDLFQKELAEKLLPSLLVKLNQEEIKKAIDCLREESTRIKKELGAYTYINISTTTYVQLSGLDERIGSKGLIRLSIAQQIYSPETIHIDTLPIDVNQLKSIKDFITDWADKNEALVKFKRTAKTIIKNCRTYETLKTKYPDIYKLTKIHADGERKIKSDLAEKRAVSDLMGQLL